MVEMFFKKIKTRLRTTHSGNIKTLINKLKYRNRNRLRKSKLSAPWWGREGKVL